MRVYRKLTKSHLNVEEHIISEYPGVNVIGHLINFVITSRNFPNNSYLKVKPLSPQRAFVHYTLNWLDRLKSVIRLIERAPF